MINVSKSYTSVATTSTAPPATFSIDSMLPSLVLLIGVVTGVITIMSTLNKSQEEKVSRLMVKIDELDTRLDSVNISFGLLNDKYATKQELVASEKRIEGYFNRMEGKFDAVIVSCKGKP